MATLIGVLTASTTFTTAAAISILVEVGAIASLFLTPSIDIGDNSPTYSFGPLSNTKTQLLPIPIIYGGPIKVAGNIFYERFLNAEKSLMYRYVGLSVGPIDSIQDVYANEYNVNDPFNGRAVKYQYVKSEPKTPENAHWPETGRDGDYVLVTYTTTRAVWHSIVVGTGGYRNKWILDIDGRTKVTEPVTGLSGTFHLNTTAATRDGRDPAGTRPYPNGIAFAALTLKAQENLSGNPTITAMLKGRLVWTPTGVKFTTNPVWIIRDLLIDKINGIGVDPALLDDASFLSAANYCDELIAGKPRFALTYVIDTQKKAVDVLHEMCACCRAYIIQRGKISIYIDQPALSYYKKIDENNIVDGSFSWWQSASDERFNRVIIEWVDPANSFEQTATVFEDVVDINRRGIVEKSFVLRGITDKAQAGRMGAYLLDSAASVINFCSFNLGLKDSDVEAGDVIAISHELTGWIDKWFRVVAVTDIDSKDDQITVVCSEYIAEIYDDRALNIPDKIDTYLPDITNPTNVSNISLVEDGYKLRDGTHIASIFATWPKVEDASFYRVYYKYGDSEQVFWQDVPHSSESSIEEISCEITNVRIGQEIIVHVKTVNASGFTSAGIDSQTHRIVGIDTPPEDVLRFTAVQSGENIIFSAENENYRDYNRTEIRHGGSSWETAVPFITAREFPVTVENRLWNGTHVFWAKSVDNGANFSVNASLTICDITGIERYKNIILERDDINNISGMDLSGVYWSRQGYLVARNSLRLEDVPVTFDTLDITTFHAEEAETIIISDVIDTYKVGSTGVMYDFDYIIAFATDPTYADIGLERSYGEYPYDTLGMISIATHAVLDIRLSEDGEEWGNWKPYLSGEYYFRYIQYRLKVITDGEPVNVNVSRLKQYYDVPDIEISDTVSVGVGGLTINYMNDYNEDFYEPPTEVITTILGGTGNVFPDVTNLSETGLTIKCYNRTGTAVAGTVKLAIRGY